MIQSNLAKIRAEIASLTNSRVDLVAVSKMKPVDSIMEAYRGDQRHFGENYVSELVEKYQRLPTDIKWHFIGHLQSNKVTKLISSCPGLHMIETIDSRKLAEKINRTLSTVVRSCRLKVLVEVVTSDEGTKSGIPPTDVLPLVRFIIDSCPNLEFDGLMTIANPSNPEYSFKIVQHLRSELELLSIPIHTLSMGMSGDYQIALKCGSNEIRLGTSIFGSRQ